MVSILTSASFSKADIHERRSRLSPNVRFWPKADIRRQTCQTDQRKLELCAIDGGCNDKAIRFCPVG